ncbi:hypothetical protein PSRA_0441 [Pseudoscardovia radai]|uniref:Uncharacterized protein n=2 Tax=Pseudoscardovia radai TaxID=987066 RepID=A0A261EZG3_9BIFI|nr:hypothetical protein PSRA_0441 [Pseudoscardovia radai]
MHKSQRGGDSLSIHDSWHDSLRGRGSLPDAPDDLWSPGAEHRRKMRSMRRRLLAFVVCLALSACIVLAALWAENTAAPKAQAVEIAQSADATSADTMGESSDTSDATDTDTTSDATASSTPAEAQNESVTLDSTNFSDPACVGADPGALRISPDGATAYIVSNGSEVCAVDIPDFTTTHTATLPGDSLGVNGGVTLSTDGARLFVATTAGIAVIDTASYAVTTLDLVTSNYVVTRDGSTLYAVVQSGGTWQIDTVDVAGGGITSQPVVFQEGADPSVVNPLIVSDDGVTVIADAQYDSAEHILAIEPATGSSTHLAVAAVSYIGCASPDGTKVYVPDSSVSNVLEVNANSREVGVISVDSQARIVSMALSADGSRLAVGTSTGAHLYDAASGAKVRDLAANEPDAYVSPDGRYLMSVSVGSDGAAGGAGAAAGGAGAAASGLTTLDVSRSASDSGTTVQTGQVYYDGVGAGGDVEVRGVAFAPDGSAMYVLATGDASSSGASSNTGVSSTTSDSVGRLIRIDLNGFSDASTAAQKSSSSKTLPLIIALVVVGCALIAGSIWIRRRLASAESAKR